VLGLLPRKRATFTGKFKKEKLMKSITLALASALTAVVGLAAADLGQARAADTEKCFGISLAGENEWRRRARYYLRRDLDRRLPGQCLEARAEGNVRNDHSQPPRTAGRSAAA
jgi:hypothetical protein